MRGRESVEAQIAKARRGTAATPGNQDTQQLQREIARFMDRNLGQTIREFGILKEKVEKMAGERGDRRDWSVRRRDLVRLDGIEKLHSAQVSGAPSESDFNALQRDVQRIHQMLAAIAELLAR